MKSKLKNQFASFLIVSFVSLLCFPAQTFAQQDAATAQATIVVNDFLEAVNSGNRTTMEQFIVKSYDQNALKRIPLFAVVSLNMSFYYETGGLGYELISELPIQSNQISAVFYNRLTATKIKIKIPVGSAPDYKINRFITAEIIKPGVNEISKEYLSEKEIISRISTCLELMEKDEEFSGTLLVAKNGNPILKKAVGEASKAYDVPNKPDTKFNIASVGKMFTGVAITQLVEQGELSFDDTIDKYVSEEWLNPEISKKIQIKHLLTHTSGLGDYFVDAYKQNKIPFFRDLKDYQMLTVDDELAFEPGTKFLYSNTGMLLLGVVMENITGEEYFTYLKKNVFEPAGMKNTDGFDKDVPVGNRATGYTKVIENGKVSWNNHQFTRIMRGSPSGGIYSTMEDMLKFDIAIRTNTLLSPGYSEIIMQGRPEINASFHSYGFFISDGPVGRIASHKGDGRGMNCQYKMFLDLGYTLVVLSNYSAPSANTIAKVFDQLIRKMEKSNL